MAIFQMYCDESGKAGDHPVVAFAGVGAESSKVLRFDERWKALLNRYSLKSFHMADAIRSGKRYGVIPKQSAADRCEALKPFADCINENLEIGLLQAYDVRGFNEMLSPKAKRHIGNPNDPYLLAFTRGLLNAVDYVQLHDRIMLICDDDQTTAWDCYRHYRGARSADPLIERKTISLSFANDRYFPGLQAADMVSVLARLEARSRFYGDRYDFRGLLQHLYQDDPAPGRAKWFHMFADRETLRGLSSAFDK